MKFSILLQPNGRYARYSATIHDFTDWNMTETQMRDRLLDDVGRHAVEEQLQAAHAAYETVLCMVQKKYGLARAQEWRATFTRPVSEVVPTLALTQAQWEPVSLHDKLRFARANTTSALHTPPTLQQLFLFLDAYDPELLASCMHALHDGKKFYTERLTEKLWEGCKAVFAEPEEEEME